MISTSAPPRSDRTRGMSRRSSVKESLKSSCIALVFSVISASCGAAQGNPTISAEGVAGVRLCQSLASVNAAYPAAVDTVVESEGEKWAAKIARFGPRSSILFETSWSDTSHVWRITAIGPKFVSPSGYRTGMSLSDVRAKGKRLQFEYEEGYIIITPDSENLSLLPDDSSASAFLKRSPLAFDSLAALPSTTRIQALVVSADCRE